ncbi:hypothetical protein MLD63_05480 [Paracoccus sp. TK19116]|uniref:Secreted protein n=1 Tax=Paracoccus albicereus TaxID=2922394 RepID=A0ABT1MNK9_9RHOB|nr:hypothetical protein [Paracoccus albicereus]MCQ0969877.1 hypothetical protein [Paracoccus albicereus]
MRLSLLLFVLAFAPLSAAADSATARCDIYPPGEDKASRSGDCTFSQAQGRVTIALDDGTSFDLAPEPGYPGNFLDPSGRRVFRQSGLGDQGLIFRLPDRSIYVYWQRGAADSDSQNPTAPFTTDDYDASALVPCGAPGQPRGQCPAGAARMEDGQASITVEGPDGEQFTMNFMKDAATGEPYVNATNREAEAALQGDTWIVIIDGTVEYEVPLALIEGG